MNQLILQFKMDNTSDGYSSSNSDESIYEKLQLEYEGNDVYQKLSWLFDYEEDVGYLRYVTRFLAGIFLFYLAFIKLYPSFNIHTG